MRGIGNMLLSRDREMGKAVTGFENRTVTAHEVSNNNVSVVNYCVTRYRGGRYGSDRSHSHKKEHKVI